jgi:hypothetical protein
LNGGSSEGCYILRGVMGQQNMSSSSEGCQAMSRSAFWQRELRKNVKCWEVKKVEQWRVDFVMS